MWRGWLFVPVGKEHRSQREKGTEGIKARLNSLRPLFDARRISVQRHARLFDSLLATHALGQLDQLQPFRGDVEHPQLGDDAIDHAQAGQRQGRFWQQVKKFFRMLAAGFILALNLIYLL